MKFTIEIRGDEDRDITVKRLEAAVSKMLDRDSSTGIVIVTKAEDE